MLLAPSDLAIVAAVGVLGAAIGGIGGFGTGAIITAVLAPLIGIKALIPVFGAILTVAPAYAANPPTVQEG